MLVDTKEFNVFVIRKQDRDDEDKEKYIHKCKILLSCAHTQNVIFNECLITVRLNNSHI